MDSRRALFLCDEDIVRRFVLDWDCTLRLELPLLLWLVEEEKDCDNANCFELLLGGLRRNKDRLEPDLEDSGKLESKLLEGKMEVK